MSGNTCCTVYLSVDSNSYGVITPLAALNSVFVNTNIRSSIWYRIFWPCILGQLWYLWYPVGDWRLLSRSREKKCRVRRDCGTIL